MKSVPFILIAATVLFLANTALAGFIYESGSTESLDRSGLVFEETLLDEFDGPGFGLFNTHGTFESDVNAEVVAIEFDYYLFDPDFPIFPFDPSPRGDAYTFSFWIENGPTVEVFQIPIETLSGFGNQSVLIEFDSPRTFDTNTLVNFSWDRPRSGIMLEGLDGGQVSTMDLYAAPSPGSVPLLAAGIGLLTTRKR